MIQTPRFNWKLVIVFIVLLCIMALTLFASAPPVKAQGGGWCKTWNFASTDGGWEPLSGDAGNATWSSGGWQPTGSHEWVYIESPVALQSGTITSYSYTLTASAVYQGYQGARITVESNSDLNVGIANVGGTGSGSGLSWPIAVSERIYLAVNFSASPLGTATWVSGEVCGTGTNPWSAPSGGGGDGSGGGFIGLCPLLGDGVATFSDLSAWTLTAGDSGTLPSAGTTGGLKLEDGKAKIQVSLSRYRTYRVDAKFHVLGDPPVAGDLFEIAVGTDTSPIRLSVPAEATAGTQSYSQDTSISTPDTTVGPSEIYNLSIEEKIGAQNLNIDFVCLTDTTVVDGPVIPPGGGDNAPGACVSCQYHASGDLISDIIGIFKWLWCGLVNIFTCVLFPALRGIWGVAQNALSVLGVARQWLGLVFQGGGDWLGGIFQIFGRWFSGTFGNGIQGIFNAVLTILYPGGAILNALIHWVMGFFEPLFRQTVGTAATVVQTIGSALELVLYYIGRFIGLIGAVISAVPVVIASLIAGFNAGPASIPVWAPTCNNTASLLYYPCLGFYVADNTVLDGPIYYAFILILGMIGVNVLLWALRATQEALS